MKVYYAHFQGIYGTPQELRDLALIRDAFPKCVIVNPSDPKIQSGYVKGSGMQYWTDLVSECDVLVFRGTPVGIPAGVQQEIEAARAYLIPVLELPSSFTKILSVPETRALLEEWGQR